MYKILEKTKLNDVVERMVIHAPHVARKCEPGQFVILCANEGDERIPLTIQDYNRKEQTVSIIYQVVGYSTQILSQKNAGDMIVHFAGPLGTPSLSHASKRVLGIGGGVGAAPLYPQIKALRDKHIACDIILGGRSKDFVILENEFKGTGSTVYCATNDGTLGYKGFVTGVLLQLLEKGDIYDEVIAIGPLVMMKAVVEVTKRFNIPTMVSLNPIMIDGTGMCGGCRVTIGGKTKFACVDGPDFNGFEVDFDEAIRRQGIYKEHEKHACNLYKGV